MKPHNSELSKFLFVGNGPYKNRGCEAIVRGTMNILRQHFGKNICADVGIYGNVSLLQEQLVNESDQNVHSL